jgi:hypothetical protein
VLTVLVASATSPLSELGIIVALLVTFAGSYFVVKARKGSADDNEAVKTATLMTGQIAALTAAQQLAEAEARRQDQLAAAEKVRHEAEIGHLRDLLSEKDKTLDRNTRDIQRLTELVTQQAAVAQFRDEAFKWFEAIATAVQADPPQFPDHVPEPV